MKINRTFYLIGLLAALFQFSCNKTKEEKDTFSSPKLLFVEYISAFTSGYVSKNSEITIKLAKEVADAKPGEAVEKNLFSFEPSLKGNAFWSDRKTIVFKPNSPLSSGQRYQAVFALHQLVEVPKGKSDFKFTFECIPQNFEVHIDGIGLYDVKNLTKVKITGSIQTADDTENELVEKILTAKQNGQNLEITFVHGMDNNHQFTIENIARTEDKEEVDIAWDGGPIGVDKDDDTTYDIPSLSDFKVTSVNITRSGDQYISVKFSDPIDDKQNLRGLVMLSKGTAPRVVVNLNELKVYVSSSLEGNVDLTIDQSIKNIAGYTLKEDFQGQLQFSQQKPNVRITANKGVIMPSSEGLIVLFEAISLNAVDLTIVRIFENNMLQYLQVNELGGEYQLQRVGRPVAQHTIPLESMGATNLNEWNRYSIDISKYIQVEPGAFYQVKISFRKSQSIYFCPDGEDVADEIIEDWDYNETTNWDNYEGDYYEDYNYYDWEERDNPCHKAYYANNRGAQKIIFASDLGIIAKKADQGDLLVFTTNLISTKPIQEALVEVYDFQQQLITSGTTDSEGKTTLKISRKPYALIVKRDKQFGYLKLDDGSSLSLSNFNVTGNTIQKGIKGFIYGERGVWRPGDTLHLSFMLDDVQNRLPEGHPIILELFNPLGQLTKQSVLTKNDMGLYVFHPVTDKDAPTGNWIAKVKVGGALFSKQLKIETVKPNRLKINLTFEGDKLYASEGAQYGNLNVRWLHGAIAKNLKASYEVLLVPAKTTFKGYEDVVFDDPSKEYITESEQIFEGRLDEQGNVRIPVKLQTGEEAPGMMKAIFKGKVFEEGGDFSIDNTSVPYVPYSSFAGVDVPEGDKRGMLVTDKDHNVRVVSLNAKGKPIDRKLEVSLYKLQWRWWWDNSWESKSNYTSSYYTKLISSGTVKTNEGEGIYKLRVNRPEWGRYMIKVKDPESGHSAAQVVYIDWPGWAGKQKRGELGGVTMLDFNVEKESVNVGEPVRINIPSSAGGRALISLETGSAVLQTFWVDTKAENTVVEFEATSAMAPNIYANITMIQPHAQTANDLPIRMYGVQAIEVIDPGTKLSPVISMPDELRSEQEFKVTVSEKNKKPMAYTIAIVEDGLLDLTKFETPEPWSTFYAREALGIKTWDVFDDVMGSYGGALEKLMSVGGDDEIKAPEDQEANRFKPVVMFYGPFYAKAGAKKEHTFKLPQYIGSVRAMVVAGYDGAYGSTEKTVAVNQPLMILATLPRVAGPAEEITLPVNVFAMDKNIKNVELSVKAEGRLATVGSSSKSISFSEPGDQVVYFKLKAADGLGIGKVHVEAKSAGLSATYDVELQVRASNPVMTQVTETLLDAGKSWNSEYNPLGLIGTNEGVVEISSLPPLNLEQRLKYLITYPHGCIEQTISAVFAQLYLKDLIKLDNEKAQKIQENINAAIERIRTFQLADGGFSYWPGNSQVNLWGTNYAGHFLVEAKKQAYHVPEDVFSNWLSYQQEQANNWNATLYKDYQIQAYRLYTLAMAGNPSLGAMNRLKGRDFSDNAAKWTLASAYAAAGYKDVAQEIIDGLTKEVKEYRELAGTYGSTQRDQAIILETLVRLDKKTDAFEMIRKISDKMGDKNYWMSTQTTAYCLLGIAEFAKNYPAQGGVDVSVDIAGNKLRVDGNRYLNQITIIEPDKKGEIAVKNNGENPLFVKMIRTGVPIEGNEVANENNIKMEVSFKNMNGEDVAVDNLKQGTDFIAEVSITNPGLRGDYQEIALTQIFPSGWEILNNRLDDTDQLYAGAKPEYQDIRDDRVLSYFDLAKNSRITIKVYLNASYQGTFYMPATSVGAMYDNSIAANTKGQWVKVEK